MPIRIPIRFCSARLTLVSGGRLIMPLLTPEVMWLDSKARRLAEQFAGVPYWDEECDAPRARQS